MKKWWPVKVGQFHHIRAVYYCSLISRVAYLENAIFTAARIFLRIKRFRCGKKSDSQNVTHLYCLLQYLFVLKIYRLD